MLKTGFAPEAMEFAKRGVPDSLRPAIWMAILGLPKVWNMFVVVVVVVVVVALLLVFFLSLGVLLLSVIWLLSLVAVALFCHC